MHLQALKLFVTTAALWTQFCVCLNATTAQSPLLSSMLNDTEWWDFKRAYNKSYATFVHELKARNAWRENLIAINTHNTMGLSYKLHANHLSDMTLLQYLRQIVKLVKSSDASHSHSLPSHVKQNSTIPEEIDWRKVGFTPDIPSQKRCGACYAFSAAHALQAQLFIAKNKWEPLSEQQIVDCSGSMGNYGCGGGSLRGAFRYLETYGAMSYKDYPYAAKKTRCHFNRRNIKATVTSWGIIPKGDEVALERAVALLGPVAASLNAAPKTFQLYHSGMYDDEDCSDEHVNHAVLIVGYTKTYWIILNWWGKHWGESGYMRIRKGENRCGIANFAAFVIME